MFPVISLRRIQLDSSKTEKAETKKGICFLFRVLFALLAVTDVDVILFFSPSINISKMYLFTYFICLLFVFAYVVATRSKVCNNIDITGVGR